MAESFQSCLKEKWLEAVILFPALGTPALVDKDSDLDIVLLIKNSIKNPDCFWRHSSPNRSIIVGTAALKSIVNFNLRVQPLDDKCFVKEQPAPKEFQAGDGKLNMDPEHKLFPKRTCLEDMNNKNDINIYYLGKPQGVVNIYKERFDSLVQEPMGILHTATYDLYTGYDYLIQVSVKEFFSKKGAGLYNISWLCPYSDSPAQYDVKDGNSATLCREPQDEFLESLLSGLNTDRDRAPLNNGQAHPNYKKNLDPAYSKGDFHFFQAASPGVIDFKTHSDKKLRFYHPIYCSDEVSLKLGVIGDAHFASRQTLYQHPDLSVQVIPGAPEEVSENIAGKVHNYARSTKEIMDKIKSQADVLCLVGDLYDHARNTSVSYFYDSVKVAGDIWAAMDNKHHLDNERYPLYIDALMALSAIIEQGQPVFFVSGNHEAYQLPYGLSPRAMKSQDEEESSYSRPNAGIPADHNLTFYEATLLYGSQFYHYPANAGNPEVNFQPRNFDFFYALLTPWTDFFVSYGYNQSFTGIRWGNGEDFISSYFGRGGTLPRATAVYEKDQLALCKQAIEHPVTHRILLSHFTYVNFSGDIPLNRENGKIKLGDAKAEKATASTFFIKDSKASATNIDINEESKGKWGSALSGSSSVSHFDHGSFHTGREQVYGELLQGEVDSRFHYALSGHSHRAGVYALGAIDGEECTVKGVAVEDYKSNIDRNQPARIIVTGSAGPLSKRNDTGELAGVGSDFPQGLLLDPYTDTLTCIKSTCATSKPRFAVLVDYLWIEEELVPFDEIGIDADGMQDIDYEGDWLETFTGSKKGTPPIASMTLSVVDVDEEVSNPFLYKGHLPLTEAKYDTVKKLEKKAKSPFFFLSIFFKQPSGQALQAYLKDYDYDSPLVIAVDVDKRWFSKGYTIKRREKTWDDEPDFDVLALNSQYSSEEDDTN